MGIIQVELPVFKKIVSTQDVVKYVKISLGTIRQVILFPRFKEITLKSGKVRLKDACLHLQTNLHNKLGTILSFPVPMRHS